MLEDDEAREPELIGMLRDASRAISKQLGCSNFPLDPMEEVSSGARRVRR